MADYVVVNALVVASSLRRMAENYAAWKTEVGPNIPQGNLDVRPGQLRPHTQFYFSTPQNFPDDHQAVLRQCVADVNEDSERGRIARSRLDLGLVQAGLDLILSGEVGVIPFDKPLQEFRYQPFE